MKKIVIKTFKVKFINEPEKMIRDIKDALRKEARTILPKIYNRKLNTVTDFGIGRHGEPVAIDTVGKKVFGLKGYKGSIIIDTYPHKDGLYKVRISLPIDYTTGEYTLLSWLLSDVELLVIDKGTIIDKHTYQDERQFKSLKYQY